MQRPAVVMSYTNGEVLAHRDDTHQPEVAE
jgi:hypothetical protein